MIALDQARQHLETLGLKQAAEILDNTLDAAASRQLPYPEMLAELLGAEVAARRERYLTTRTRLAHLPFQRTLEQFDFGFHVDVLRFGQQLTGQGKCQSDEGPDIEPLEQTRLYVLNSVLEHQLPVAQAAEILGVSERHAWRLLAAYRREGAAALAHGNRGRKPRNTVSDNEANAVVQLASTTYAGSNHTHLTELLKEREGIDLSRPTVRRILTRAGISSPSHRRPPKHRVRRQRMPQPGMLVQIDGSFHRWLGDDGPQFTLLLTVEYGPSGSSRLE